MNRRTRIDYGLGCCSSRTLNLSPGRSGGPPGELEGTFKPGAGLRFGDYSFQPFLNLPPSFDISPFARGRINGGASSVSPYHGIPRGAEGLRTGIPCGVESDSGCPSGARLKGQAGAAGFSLMWDSLLCPHEAELRVIQEAKMKKRNQLYPGYVLRKNAVEKYLRLMYPHEFKDGKFFHKTNWVYHVMDRYGLANTNCQRRAIFEYSELLLELGKITPDDLVSRTKDLLAAKPGQKWHPKRKQQAKAERAGKKLPFYQSWDWAQLRYRVLQKYGAKCMCCGITGESGARIMVDHIKPRSKFPELELEFDNMQVLCDSCNRGKSNTDFTDWRAVERWTIQ